MKMNKIKGKFNSARYTTRYAISKPRKRQFSEREEIKRMKNKENMNLETERLILRPWRESDAADLYEYAKDSRVGPIAGWPPHKSVEESAEIIRTVFAQDGVFAVTLKGEDRAVGCVGLIRGAKSNFPISDDEGEISYWIGVPFWGKGLIPEAVREIIRYGFEKWQLHTLWCGYFDGNGQSRKVQEKCGFRYHHTNRETFCPYIKETRTEHVCRLTKNEWQSLNGKI